MSNQNQTETKDVTGNNPTPTTVTSNDLISENLKNVIDAALKAAKTPEQADAIRDYAKKQANTASEALKQTKTFIETYGASKTRFLKLFNVDMAGNKLDYSIDKESGAKIYWPVKISRKSFFNFDQKACKLIQKHIADINNMADNG